MTMETRQLKTYCFCSYIGAKAVLKGKFIAIQPYLNIKEKHQTDHLTLHLKQLEKEQQQQQQQKTQD